MRVLLLLFLCISCKVQNTNKTEIKAEESYKTIKLKGNNNRVNVLILDTLNRR